MILTHLSLQSLKAYAEFYASVAKYTNNSENVISFYNQLKLEINKRNAKLSC